MMSSRLQATKGGQMTWIAAGEACPSPAHLQLGMHQAIVIGSAAT